MTLPPHDHFHLLHQRVSLRQGQDGLRAGTDCVLLAAVPVVARQVLELGCAVGQSLLCYAVRHSQARLTGIERLVDDVSLAQKNIVDNALENRMRVICGDFSDRHAMQQQKIHSDDYDLVLMNPPYYAPKQHTPPEHTARLASHIEQTPLSVWLEHGLRYCRQFGHVAIIHRPERLGEIFAGLHPKAGNIRLWLVHARADRLAQRVIVVAQKSRRGTLQIMPALIMHGSDSQGRDGYSASAKRLLEQAESLPVTKQY